MRTLWATVLKELLELRRDRAGLAIILAMPDGLVLIVSLVQDSVMQATGESPIRVLFVESGSRRAGDLDRRQDPAASGIELVETSRRRRWTRRRPGGPWRG